MQEPAVDRDDSAKEVQVQGYVTAYIDLLGLSNSLAQFDQFTGKSMDKATALPLLQASVGRIVAFRQILADVYAHMQPPSVDDPRMDGLSTDQGIAFRESLTHNSTIHWFSDCCTISVPFEPDAVEQLLNGVLRMFYALSFLTIVMLTRDQPLRGGIEIGYGVELARGEILGSSLTKAYALETTTEMPRIAVGTDLTQIVCEPLEQLATGLKQKPVKWMCKTIQSMLGTSMTDPTVFLDFLSNEATKNIVGLPEGRKLIDTAASRIAAGLENPELMSNGSIRSKYQWLHEYFKYQGYWPKNLCPQ